ncbi:hypothetical protein [Pseudonocardia endophytica]|uniref:Putative amidophosphoribosyltransferase n=1 Tax=Pseudonocardia endophytica TaxID=401976 RepID=A0A4R1HSJ0_PSEEN|nr:hypothetical protein [Pseudonocardia endophytica]TCK20352.1 putative amidophosphoribosyltransferase [Pseudonocardia endophytica]
MTGSPEFADRARAVLYARVGAIFANTARGPGHCAVCTGPTGAPGFLACQQCSRQRAEFGSELADLVVPLAYVQGWMSPPHQSQHHVRRYKSLFHPSARCAEDLELMVAAASAIHGPCIASEVGWWDVLTFVPSVTRCGVDHPVVGLARRVFDHGRRVDRVVLAPTDDLSTVDRRPQRGAFTMPADHAAAVRGRHVLVVDDTWVSGAKAQSAALTLKAVGASRVTILCVGRWLSHQWDEHRRLIDSGLPPYDALACPVGPGACRGPQP